MDPGQWDGCVTCILSWEALLWSQPLSRRKLKETLALRDPVYARGLCASE